MAMEKRKKRMYQEMEQEYEEDQQMLEIRKGPWKAEEDQVLLNHVEKYGPRDWSSIRSKGLLQRTGKSCRLRWVNKLRPNLKNGCKFSTEEENTVIELQAKFGNKWAMIARHLPGRTDNDVKNFWSSRQKRLARILQSHAAAGAAAASSWTRPQRPRKDVTASKEAINSTAACMLEGEPSFKTYPDQSSSFEYVGAPNTTYMAGFANPICLDFMTNPVSSQLNPIGKISYNEPPQWHFPSFPQPTTLEIAQCIAMQEPPPSESIDSGFVDVIGQMDPCGLMEIPGEDLSFFQFKFESEKTMTADSFFDDLPADVFDQVEPLPSPSKW